MLPSAHTDVKFALLTPYLRPAMLPSAHVQLGLGPVVTIAHPVAGAETVGEVDPVDASLTSTADGGVVGSGCVDGVVD